MVFEDPSRRRSRLAIAGLCLVVIAAGVLAIDLSLMVLHTPTLPTVEIERSDDPHRFVYAADARPATQPKASTSSPNQAVSAPAVPQSPPSALQRLNSLAWIRSAFVVQDDPMSVHALEQRLQPALAAKTTTAARSAGNAPPFDIVFPDTFAFSKADGSFREHVDPHVHDLLHTAGIVNIPRLSNTTPKGVWDGDVVSRLLRKPDARAALIAGITDRLVSMGAGGINLDLENLNWADKEQVSDWVAEWAKALHAKGLLLTIDLPINEGVYDYELLGSLADFTVLMEYDQSYPGSAPGPVAGHDWFLDGLVDGLKRIPREKLLVGIGAYGYDWNTTALQNGTSGKGDAESLTFAEAMMLADEAGADVETDPIWRHPHFRYKDVKGAQHAVWFLDAVTGFNQALSASRYRARGLAVWRLGTEDPQLWPALDLAHSTARDPSQLLARVEPLDQVVYVNNGECYRVKALSAPGSRSVTLDADGLVEFAHYDALPTACLVEKTGRAGPHEVALTFDDGPDPVWTTQILDILRDNDVPATFFMVGSLVETYPEVAQRMVREGHLVGNHSYVHPDLSKVRLARVPVEINAAERAIEAATGKQTVLFRAPYDADVDPVDVSGLRPMHVVNQMGFLTVGAAIDSEDFRAPGVDTIVQNVLKGLEKGRGGVIVMHDAGGDRTQTVAALHELIPAIRQAGYRFVTIADILHRDAAELNPPAPASEHVIIAGANVWAWMSTTGWGVIRVLFAVTTIIALFRIAFLGIVVLRNARRTPPVDGLAPEATVLIPAYNEERVIERTIRAVLSTTDGHVRVLVIDDGSTDGTARKVEAIAATNPRVRLIVQQNAGKAVAMNRGLREAHTEAVVAIDADTLILPGTIRALLAPLADPAVDAVCGNVQVGNVRNLLTACQDVEYVTSQNYDRRAFDSLNCINVVPGATGAWRRERILAVGGYSHHTLTEDADLTLSLLRLGGRIVYAEDARSVTEAPETMRALYKQRFRWSFGTFQCLWKHRAAFGHGTLGWIALPNVVIFQILFPLLSPLGDAVLLLSLIKGDFSAIVAGYLVFVVLDLIASVAAFRLDRRPLGRLWVVLIQRFFYRQFMYVVTLRAVWAALRGRRHGWNKLERRDSINVEHDVAVAAA